jgi:type II secretory pathway pseudopilin PulG
VHFLQRKQQQNISRGYSLLEVMFAVSVLVVVGLGAGALMGRLGGQQAQMASKDEANELIAGLSKWLNTVPGCQSAFQGKTFPINGETNFQIGIGGAGGYKGFGASVLLNNGTVSSTGELRSGTRISPTLSIKRLILRDKRVPPSVTWIEGRALRKVVAQVEAQMEVVLQKGGAAGRDKTTDLRSRFIELPILLSNTSDVMERCAGETSLADMCSALGSVFDPATGNCRPLANCLMQGTYTTINGGPGAANPLTGASSCPDGAVPSQTGFHSYSMVVECGKKCTTTVTVTVLYFICLRCT